MKMKMKIKNFDLELDTKIEKMCQYDTAYVY